MREHRKKNFDPYNTERHANEAHNRQGVPLRQRDVNSKARLLATQVDEAVSGVFHSPAKNHTDVIGGGNHQP